MKYLFILGRQTGIALAELESLYGGDNVMRINPLCALVETKQAVFSRIGGSIKMAEVLTTIPSQNLSQIKKVLENLVLTQSERLPEGKLKIGISSYGLPLSPGQINALGLSIKKSLKSTGRSARIVPNTQSYLDSAQVLHNKLTGEKGLEIILTTDGKNTVVAKCLEVQDINSYTLRDRSRPKRDSKAGMLPPKLAQIIINLATGNTAPSGKLTVLDPFCGTGVTLIEANLMGFSSLGSDLEQKMIANSQANLDWAKTSLNLPKNVTSDIENGDATRHKWRNPFIFVASEIYLGRPFTSPPDRSTLLDTIRACDIILAKFLKNISPQLTKDARLSLAVPAWFIKEQVYHLSTLDKLTQLGYNRIKFVHASQRELIYHRPGQFVARELVVLERIQDVKS